MSRVLVPLAAVLALAVLPSSALAKSCSVQKDAGSFGVTYVTSLTVKGVSCATGKSLLRAYHKCRKARGGIKGRCPSVNGWSCSEQRTNGPVQFSAKATCRKGARRVVHTYTQNT